MKDSSFVPAPGSARKQEKLRRQRHQERLRRRIQPVRLVQIGRYVEDTWDRGGYVRWEGSVTILDDGRVTDSYVLGAMTASRLAQLAATWLFDFGGGMTGVPDESVLFKEAKLLERPK